MEYTLDDTPLLGSLAQLVDGLNSEPDGAFRLTRAERDQLVIFDPSCAPLLHQLITELHPWYAPADAWLIGIPAGHTARLLGERPDEARAWAGFSARYPALARRLNPWAEQAHTRPAYGDYWWELAADPPLAPAAPRIMVALDDEPVVAWDEGRAALAAPAVIVAAAEPYWLALLGSQTGRRLLHARSLESFPIPEAPAPTRSSMAGLALGIAEAARERREVEQAFARRLLADFGPPGAQLSPRLSRWWELEFAELCAATLADLHNVIPDRFQSAYSRMHGESRAAYLQLSARMRELGDALEKQATGLLGLNTK